MVILGSSSIHLSESYGCVWPKYMASQNCRTKMPKNWGYLPLTNPTAISSFLFSNQWAGIPSIPGAKSQAGCNQLGAPKPYMFNQDLWGAYDFARPILGRPGNWLLYLRLVSCKVDIEKSGKPEILKADPNLAASCLSSKNADMPWTRDFSWNQSGKLFPLERTQKIWIIPQWKKPWDVCHIETLRTDDHTTRAIFFFGRTEGDRKNTCNSNKHERFYNLKNCRARYREQMLCKFSKTLSATVLKAMFADVWWSYNDINHHFWWGWGHYESKDHPGSEHIWTVLLSHQCPSAFFFRSMTPWEAKALF